MFWVMVALLVTVAGFIANIFVAKMVHDMEFAPNNVGVAYGMFGGCWMMLLVGLAWYLSGASTAMSIIIGVVIGLVPLCMVMSTRFRQWLNATISAWKSWKGLRL